MYKERAVTVLEKTPELLSPRELTYLQRSYRALLSAEANSPFLLLVLLVPKPQLVLEYPVAGGRKTRQEIFILGLH